ncbi:MAG TPA: hypothetical protein VL137_12325 [Polyangiaceae bacterium]|nr:hypothetical protein [Polyangiaceae bacterium]
MNHGGSATGGSSVGGGATGSNGGSSAQGGSSVSAGGSNNAGAHSAGGNTAIGGSNSAGAAGDSPTGGQSGGGAPDVDAGPQYGTKNCNPANVLCRIAPPSCEFLTVPEVVDNCYGPCVRVSQCACMHPQDCPQPDQYTCYNSDHFCGPFVE